MSSLTTQERRGQALQWLRNLLTEVPVLARRVISTGEPVRGMTGDAAASIGTATGMGEGISSWFIDMAVPWLASGGQGKATRADQ